LLLVMKTPVCSLTLEDGTTVFYHDQKVVAL
jgi:hypothetical protein